MSDLATIESVRIAGKFRLKQKIGVGSFGTVYMGINIINKKNVAVKLEPFTADHPQLEYEADIYRKLTGIIGIPRMHWFGAECNFNIMVLDLLGPSLEELFISCNRRFSMKTVLLLADQLIQRVELVHSHDYIHRDIKPSNFAVGNGILAARIHIIDFGLAKKYRDHSHIHMPYTEEQDLIGTAQFTSINAHQGIELSRRDDLESLALMLIYFLRGSLPWQNQKGLTERQRKIIFKMKTNTPSTLLCQGLPEEFALVLDYTRALHFADTPDYTYIRHLFTRIFNREGYKYDNAFDWTEVPPKLPAHAPKNNPLPACTRVLRSHVYR